MQLVDILCKVSGCLAKFLHNQGSKRIGYQGFWYSEHLLATKPPPPSSLYECISLGYEHLYLNSLPILYLCCRCQRTHYLATYFYWPNKFFPPLPTYVRPTNPTTYSSIVSLFPKQTETYDAPPLHRRALHPSLHRAPPRYGALLPSTATWLLGMAPPPPPRGS